jgi:group I intron endonuclease
MIVYNQIPKKLGVYKFTNKLNGLIYIGKSFDMRERARKHRYAQDDTYFHRSIKKYGWENFEIEILQDYEIGSVDNWELLALETAFIDYFESLTPKGYNVCFFGNLWKEFKHTPETKAKLKKLNIGKVASQITKERMSSSIKGLRLGCKLSEETKKKISLTLKERFKDPLERQKMKEFRKKQDMSFLNKKVIQIDRNTGVVLRIWDSAREAAIAITGNKKRSSDISSVCKKRIKTAMNFYWEHLDINNPTIMGDIKQVPIVKPSNLGREFSKEWREKISIAKKGRNNPNWGKKFSKERIENGALKHRKQVKQININTGEIIKIWDSLHDASIFFSGFKFCRIGDVCRKKIDKEGYQTKSAYGFKWEYIL